MVGGGGGVETQLTEYQPKFQLYPQGPYLKLLQVGLSSCANVKKHGRFNRPFLLSQPAFDDNVLNDYIKSLSGGCSLVLDY